MRIQSGSQTLLCVCVGGGGGGGLIGQILGPFMIRHGLSCNCIGFGHIGGRGAQMTSLTPPPPPPFPSGLRFRNKTPILPTVKMLGLGGERLTPKFWIITCTTIWLCHCYYVFFFPHLLILET